MTVAKLQNDLNALLNQPTKKRSEEHLVLSMLSESYIQRLNAIGFSYDTLLGFYQETSEVIEAYLKQQKLGNLLHDESFNTQKLLKSIKTEPSSFLLRWNHLDFENALSQHFEVKEAIPAESTEEEHPIFSRPFFIAFKGLRS